MALVAVTADLHLGITPFATVEKLAAEIAESSPDAVVLAGDLVERPVQERLPLLLATFRRILDCPIAICAGNHDLWTDDKGPNSHKIFFEVMPAIAREHGCIWLDEQNLVLPDASAIAGSIAWYDYSDRSPVTRPWNEADFKAVKSSLNNDGVFVHWHFEDPEFARLIGDRLCARLRNLEGDPLVRAVMVCTHVPAFIDQAEVISGDNPVMRSFFAIPSLGEKLVAFGKIETVVSGHTHREVLPIRLKRKAGRDMILATLGSDYYDPKFQLFRL